MISTLLTLFVIGIAGLVVLSLLGAVLGIAVSLLFKVLPILVIGYIILRLIAPKPKKMSSEDKEWLDS